MYVFELYTPILSELCQKQFYLKLDYSFFRCTFWIGWIPLMLLKISYQIRNMGYLKYKYIHILNIVYEYVLIYPRLKTMFEIQKNP